MKLWAAVVDAAAGWKMILRGDPDWRTRFRLTGAGLALALVIFAFVAFLAVAFASMSIGMPSTAGVMLAMFVLGLPILSLLLVLLATRRMLGTKEPLLDFLVPGINILAVFLLVEGLIALVSGPFVLVSWVALGYALYRLARSAATWNAGIAAGFAAATVALLVAMRMALYMLTT